MGQRLGDSSDTQEYDDGNSFGVLENEEMESMEVDNSETVEETPAELFEPIVLSCPSGDGILIEGNFGKEPFRR